MIWTALPLVLTLLSLIGIGAQKMRVAASISCAALIAFCGVLFLRIRHASIPNNHELLSAHVRYLDAYRDGVTFAYDSAWLILPPMLAASACLAALAAAPPRPRQRLSCSHIDAP